MSNLLKDTKASPEYRRLTMPLVFQETAPPKDEKNELKSAEDMLAKLADERERLEQEIDRLEKQRKTVLDELENERLQAREEIKTWWQAEKEKSKAIQEEAYRDGYDRGFAEGEVKAEEQYQKKLEEAEKIVEAAYRHKQDIIAQSEAEVLRLSVAMARKILGIELTETPNRWKSLVATGLSQVLEREEVVLYLPASLYPQLLPYIEEWSGMVDGVLKVLPDRTLSDERCLIKTEHGTYDLSIDQQLEAINKQLIACFEERIAGDRED